MSTETERAAEAGRAAAAGLAPLSPTEAVSVARLLSIGVAEQGGAP